MTPLLFHLFSPTGNATISKCGLYRYDLERPWDDSLPVLVFCMLNPSKADDHKNDPTVVRCIGFAKANGYGGIVIVNMFAFRSTDPKQLVKAADPVGPYNDDTIRRVMSVCMDICFAWGAHGDRYPDRVREVQRIVEEGSARIWCLGVTVTGQPCHPVRLPKDRRLERWPVRSAA